MSSLLIRSRAFVLSSGVEALASWVLRLAHNNGYKSVGALCTGERLGIKHKKAFDAAVSDEALEAVGSLVLADINSLPRLTLRDPLTILTGCAQGSGGLGAAKGRWLLKHPRETYGARYSFCCRCLAADEVPFLRRDWRLSISCWCPSHGCELTDACPGCGAALVLSTGRCSALSRCEFCDCDFTKIAESGGTSAYPLTGAPFQVSGDCFSQELLPVPVALPHLWWDGVRILLELCVRPPIAAKLADTDLSNSSKGTLHQIATRGRIDFDKQPTRVRAGLLRVVSELVENWPVRFVGIFSQAQLTRTHVAMTELAPPYWLARVCEEHLNRKRYVTTKDEALAAIALLRRNATAVSKNSIKATLGIAESKVLDTIMPPRKSLTLSQFARVARQIDHNIRRTNKARDEQASALRDACCIAVAAWRGIGFERSAKLALVLGVDLASEWAMHAPSEAERAFILGRFAEWFALYLQGVRPRFARFAPKKEEDSALFLTRFGSPYKGFGVAALFARALRECEIPDWSRGARLLVGAGLPDLLRQGKAPQGVLPSPVEIEGDRHGPVS
jgi:hypothetical protein